MLRTSATPGSSRDLTTLLPVELKRIVLDYVDRHDVVVASSLSQSWYAAASSNCQYSLVARFAVQPSTSTIVEFRNRLELAHKRQLKILLNIKVDSSILEHDMLSMSFIDDARRALEEHDVTLVALYSNIPAWIAPLFFKNFATVSAPMLFELHVEVTYPPNPPGSSISPVLLPITLFNGHAPRLRVVCLHDTLPPANVPALSSATRLKLTYTRLLGISIDIGSCFPRAADVFLEHHMEDGVPRPSNIQLGSTKTIERLHVVQHSDSFELHGLDELSIPELVLHNLDLGTSPPFHLDRWEEFDAPVRMSVRNDSNLEDSRLSLALTVSSGVGGRSIQITGRWNHLRDSWPWCDAPFARVHALELDQDVVHTLFEHTTHFPALEELKIFVVDARKAVWPPLHYARFRPGYVGFEVAIQALECPALRRIVLERHPESKIKRACISTRDMTKLGRNIGLDDSARSPVKLTLRELQWKTTPRAPLCDMFIIEVESGL